MSASLENGVAISSEPLRVLVAGFEQAAALSAGHKQVRAMAAIVRAFLWSAGITRPDEISVAAVESYLAGLVRRGRSRKTLWNHRSAISRFCEFLRARGLLEADPCRAVRLRRPEETVPRWLDDGEIEQVLGLARAEGIWPEVCLALATGLRLGELIRLQWADVDVAGRSLVVRKSKTGRGRVVPLCAAALEALAEQRERTGQMACVFPGRQTWPGGWRYVDRPRPRNWWERAIRPLQQAVPKFLQGMAACATGRGWHLFRHTFASKLAQGGGGAPGVSIWKIAAWLGHSDVRTTRIYAHLRAGFDVEIERAMPVLAGAPQKGDRR